MAQLDLPAGRRPISITEVARILQTTNRAVRSMVTRGEIAPVDKLPGRTGALLFDAATIEKLARQEADEAQARATAIAEQLAQLGGAA